jgi:hypothetical protein
MCKTMKFLTGICAIAIAAALSSGLSAHEPDRSSAAGSPTGRGGMMGMMPMMGNMGSMMEGCGQMMQGMKDGRSGAKPNEQWQPQPPAKPDKNG